MLEVNGYFCFIFYFHQKGDCSNSEWSFARGRYVEPDLFFPKEHFLYIKPLEGDSWQEVWKLITAIGFWIWIDNAEFF